MYIDKQNMVSAAQAVTASAGSTDYIDLGAARNIGTSGVTFAITVDQAVTAAGDATVTFSIQSDDNTSFSSPATVVATGAIGKAELTAGRAPIYLTIPAGMRPERYLRAYFTVGTGPLTAGQFTVAVVEGEQASRAYPGVL
jgi:thioredoxin reductase